MRRAVVVPMAVMLLFAVPLLAQADEVFLPLVQCRPPTADTPQTPTAMPTITPPVITGTPGVLVVDGVDDYAEAPDRTTLDVGVGGESVTFEAWVNIQGTSGMPSPVSVILGKNGSYLLYTIRYGVYPDRTRCDGIRGTADSGQEFDLECCTTSSYSLGWHHLAGVLDFAAGEIRLYRDGKLRGTRAVNASGLWDSASSLRLGDVLAGEYDAVRISAAVLYSGDTYTEPPPPTSCESSTRVLWRFDGEPGATAFADICGSGATLTAHNGAHWQAN